VPNTGLLHSTARRRVVGAALIGSAAALAIAWVAPWQLTVLTGWDVGALVLLLWVWMQVGPMDADGTRAWATREDDSRRSSELLLLAASSTSLLGVAVAFSKANEGDAVLEPLLTTVGVLTTVVSWAVVHTTFTLRYAHLYYTEPAGGIEFKTKHGEPDYHDFAYVSFTVGMTYQVSDTDVTRTSIRRTVLRHALLSFLFGAVILATVVNVIAGLLRN
jgi:uncharacterized membrane protein